MKQLSVSGQNKKSYEPFEIFRPIDKSHKFGISQSGYSAKKYRMQASTFGQPLIRWITILRISIGFIYVWFGVLKFFPGLSPAEDLAKSTIHLLTFKIINPDLSLLMLAIWETAVGILLVAGFFTRVVIRVVLVHMICTFAPLILLPAISFTTAPFSLTLVGQYIIKNVVIISGLFVIDAAKPLNERLRRKPE
jgi:uncharacterized membrane protein YphA (DoxX/SURF4 family)